MILQPMNNVTEGQSFPMLHIASSLFPSIDSIAANWFVCLASIVIADGRCWDISPRFKYFIIIFSCQCDTSSGSCCSSQPLLWDCVQQKMGQAVNYHKCSGK